MQRTHSMRQLNPYVIHSTTGKCTFETIAGDCRTKWTPIIVFIAFVPESSSIKLIKSFARHTSAPRHTRFLKVIILILLSGHIGHRCWLSVKWAVYRPLGNFVPDLPHADNRWIDRLENTWSDSKNFFHTQLLKALTSFILLRRCRNFSKVVDENVILHNDKTVHNLPWWIFHRQKKHVELNFSVLINTHTYGSRLSCFVQLFRLLDK